MPALGEVLTDLDCVFRKHGVRWYLFGAQAVAVWAAARATQDVDVTVEVAGSAARDLIQDLESGGFQHRFPEIAHELLGAGTAPLLHRSGLEVDIVLAGPGIEERIASAALAVSVDGVVIPVATATHLVVLKLLAARGKDLDDAESLLATGRVDLVEARDLLDQLDRALDRSDLVRSLDQLWSRLGTAGQGGRTPGPR